MNGGVLYNNPFFKPESSKWVNIFLAQCLLCIEVTNIHVGLPINNLL